MAVAPNPGVEPNVCDSMWPALIFVALVVVVLVSFWWRERQHRQEQIHAQQEYTARALQQQQEAYGRARAQQQALFNSMVEGVLLLDKEGRVQLVNQSLQRLFDLQADIRGQTILEAFRLPELSALAERLPQERTVSGFELDSPGSEQRRFEVNAAAVLDREGQQQGAIFVFHDLTRLRQLENTRREFVANVSHELRTPLSLIKGFVETLLDGAKDDPALCKRHLQIIDKHTDRQIYLIEDLLTISRLESGQIVMNRQRVEAREVLARVMEDLKFRDAEKNVRIQNLVPAGLSAQADADRLQQVFFNLLENAIKYGRAGGNVSVGGRELADNRIELWVQDDGPGIPPEAKERVFERFYRVDKARSRETGGTGLGLSIVKHIVQAHGGEVWVDSEPGQGATFFFTLPKA